MNRKGAGPIVFGTVMAVSFDESANMDDCQVLAFAGL